MGHLATTKTSPIYAYRVSGASDGPHRFCTPWLAPSTASAMTIIRCRLADWARHNMTSEHVRDCHVGYR